MRKTIAIFVAAVLALGACSNPRKPRNNYPGPAINNCNVMERPVKPKSTDSSKKKKKSPWGGFDNEDC